jgi:glycosyltransferase involved in cell wall biosynthesis
MIPASTDGVNYYRLATWAFEMRKYKNTIVDLLWFKYEIDPSRPHPWQEDMQDHSQSYFCPELTTGQYIRASIDRACELADIVIWHPMFYDWSFEFYLEMQHKHQKPFVVEVDDNYVDVPPWNEAFHSFKNGSSYRRIGLDTMRNADALFVTTPHLAYTYGDINDNIYLIENSLDFKSDRKFVGWDDVSVRKHRGTRIGWIGGRSHYNDLMLVVPALKEILSKYEDVTLCLVNSALMSSCKALNVPYPFEGYKNVHYSDHSVAINRYAKFAASFGFDIGIAPLVDCNFNRSKSNLRWLEYSALKIPTVAANVGHFIKTVRPGMDGILVKADDQTQWINTLSGLIEDSSARETLGNNAYKRIKKDFNVSRNAPKYLRLLKNLANSSVQEDLIDNEAVMV